MKNADGRTAHEIFIENHRHLVYEGEKWIKETSNQCMVVATLISAIGFSATFRIPGGYDQNNGFPMFRQNKALLVFVILDAISFLSSSFSILFFLSLATSN